MVRVRTPVQARFSIQIITALSQFLPLFNPDVNQLFPGSRNNFCLSREPGTDTFNMENSILIGVKYYACTRKTRY